ncbi:MAG: hypothetical protein U0075_10145 [Thermomicrobiales bacterium]
MPSRSSLLWGTILAIIRSTRSPVLLPRACGAAAVTYIDIFHGAPAILVYILTLGMPALRLQGPEFPYLLGHTRLHPDLLRVPV